MKRIYSTVRRKGQITIPAEVRKNLALEAGDKVAFVVEDGKVGLEPAGSWVARTAGIFRGRGPVLTAEELRDVAEQAWADESVERMDK